MIFRGIDTTVTEGSRQVVAIIDIDCAELKGFDGDDRNALEEFAKLIADSCDF